MLEYTTRPLADKTWMGGRTRPRRESQFTAKFVETLDDLERELKHLKAKEIVIEVDLRADQIRNDGRPRSDARAASPGVRLAFESVHGPLIYECDTYVRGSAKAYRGGVYVTKMVDDWMHNLRAIAMTLKSQRDMERHGAVRDGQQYTGWKALGAGTAMPASHMTYDAALEIVANASGVERIRHGAEGPAVKDAMRIAKARTHPDANGGRREQWNLLEQAVIVINRRHGW